MKHKRTDFIIIGFALFSMFFGAGNLIFPPLLGENLGLSYIIGIIGFIITGVGIPLLGVLASMNVNGRFESFADNVGKKFSIIYSITLFILIGPLLAIPRTAATTYEIAIAPNFPSINPLIIIILYFAINLFFVLKPSKVIDALGKFLTPILLIVLFILIVKGVINPLSNLSISTISNPLSTSLLEGYQTMDAIASIIFASLVLGTIKSKGYKGKSIRTMVLKSSFVAVGGLAIIYGGLMFLGAHTGTLCEDMSKSQLLLFLSKSILGNLGSIIIAITMGLACLTTSIGLLSAGGTFFERISKGKLKYTVNVLIMSAIGIYVASMGLENIVSLSSILLSIIYPVTIILILLNLFHNYISKKSVYKYTVYTTLIFSILIVISQYIPSLHNLIAYLPLQSIGFGWITPCLISLITSILLCKN